MVFADTDIADIFLADTSTDIANTDIYGRNMVKKYLHYGSVFSFASPYRVGRVAVISTRPAAVCSISSDSCWRRGQLGHRHLYSNLSRTYCRDRV